MSVAALLGDYFRSEDVERRCEGCARETAVATRSLATPLPCALMLHLKRFDAAARGGGSHGPSGAPARAVKLSTAVEVEREIELKAEVGIEAAHRSAPASMRYELRAVVSHHGGSMACGHYTCVARTRGADGATWVEFDDDRRPDVAAWRRPEAPRGAAEDPTSDPAHRRGGYLLLYEAVEGR